MFSASMSSNAAVTGISSHLGLASPDQILEDVLSEHDEYLHKFVELYSALIENEEALNAEERYYIAMMAACRHKCSVLVSEQKERFRDQGGPVEWLDGLEHAPERIRCLHKANIILAHRPWMFHRTHIEEMVKAGLSLSEIVHALTIMAYFHAMSSMLHALGIEAASGGTHCPMPAEVEGEPGQSPGSSELSTGGVKVLLKRLKSISCSNTDSAAGGYSEHHSNCEPVMPDLGDLPLDRSQDDKFRRYSIFSPNMSFSYEDFYRRGEKSLAPTLKYRDLWEEIGFSMVTKFSCQELADAIDNKFKIALNMTYNTCGDQQNVNTTHFRRAIWNYTQKLYGISRDDYDYSHINTLLDRHLKLFLKTMSIAPERLAAPDPSVPAIINDLMTSEQVHIVIIAAEARLQAEMVYAMMAFERYFM